MRNKKERAEYENNCKPQSSLLHNRRLAYAIGNRFRVGSDVLAQKVGGPLGHVSETAMLWFAAANLAYGTTMVVTIWTRHHLPKLGRRLTQVLNWALLPALPMGTIIGLYGFWKVDRSNKD